MFDQGEGPPVVVIPGLQGRWEWARPALAQLSRRCRTISYSLCGDLGSRMRLRPELGFDNYVQQLDRVLDRARLERVVICGVSFGGLVALRYAAARSARTAALILASTPGPGWKPTAQQAGWVARPWLSAPVFVATSPTRVWPEVSASFPRLPARLAFLARQGVRCLTAPMVPSLMAARVNSVASLDVDAACRSITAPTLVITGEESLDRIVPVGSTRRYVTGIRGAGYAMLPRTGHMGLLTQPAAFATLVSEFAHAHYH